MHSKTVRRPVQHERNRGWLRVSPSAHAIHHTLDLIDIAPKRSHRAIPVLNVLVSEQAPGVGGMHDYALVHDVSAI